ncbi:CASP-like protein 4C1 [Hibiscus syriacus]|uniref:CASP-like protein n=1 Tax=Hibiscus syriacus TaxID=106335 RepID=A0A6A3B586_HIBSY|nr:CASP-like protein 4C1 [Hibiscus syriacus]
MRSPQAFLNGDTPSPHFHNTVTLCKLRRFNSLILVFRVTAFTSSLASSVLMVTNYRGSDSPHWFDFDAFRFVFAANAIVALYSLFEMGFPVWEISTGATLFPEILQVLFDFGHDQVFAYLLQSVNSAGMALVKTLKGEFTILELADAVKLINPEVKILMVENTPDDPRQRNSDITKPKELLGLPLIE